VRNGSQPFNPEATPDGILISRRTIGVLRRYQGAGSGDYDRDVVKGMRMLSCIWEASEAGWIALSAEKEIILWRWLVVTVFVTELLEVRSCRSANDSGGFDKGVIYCGKHGGMSIYQGQNDSAWLTTLKVSPSKNLAASRGRKSPPDLQEHAHHQSARIHAFRLGSMLETLHDSFIEQLRKKACQTCRLCTEEDENEHCNDQ
jgi:hypothetical protein